MNKLLSLQVPGFDQIGAPAGVPTGGLGQGSQIIQTLITVAFVVAAIVALFMFIYSGIEWIRSQGDKQKLEAARHRIMYTIIGLIVIFLSFGIVNLVGTFFGVNLLGGTSEKNSGSQNQDRKQQRQRNQTPTDRGAQIINKVNPPIS